MSLPSNSQDEFDSRLASYAVKHENTLGRKTKEISAKDRNEFQRDATRIMHSEAFRRLQYKTQVFSNHEGDLFRTRLTHSLEVAQISKSMARALYLNEDLVEALALGHDLGHAPFGYAGQEALNEAMMHHGGFNHNLQALWIVDHLEKAYTQFNGLNLLHETREGLLKNCSEEEALRLRKKAKKENDESLLLLTDRFVHEEEKVVKGVVSPSLEAQVSDLGDAIAYTHADLEDAVNMGLLSLEQIAKEVPLFKEGLDLLIKKQGLPRKEDHTLYTKEVAGMMLKIALKNSIETSYKSIQEAQLKGIEDVRKLPRLIQFSESFFKDHHQPLKDFLNRNVYTHPDIERWRSQQKQMVLYLCEEFKNKPQWMLHYQKKDTRDLSKQITDYIGSLTDRSFMVEFTRVSDLAHQQCNRKAIKKKILK